MKILSLDDLPWEDLPQKKRRVFLRADFNVPIQSGEVLDDFRIKQVIPTIENLLQRGAVVVIGTHLGRPQKLGLDKRSKLSLLPVAERLTQLMNRDLIFSEESLGSGVRKLIQDSKPGETVILLENLRFYEGEEANDSSFAEKLFENCDVYVNDAFGASHRAHASIDAITRYARLRAAGLLLSKEYQVLEQVLSSPKKPQMAVLGGAKIEDKIQVIERLIDSCSEIFIGGRMGLSFLAAKGVSLGATKLESSAIQMAKRILADAKKKSVQIHYPQDARVAQAIDSKDCRIKLIDQIDASEGVFDLGPQTMEIWKSHLKNAKSIVWNGPLGVFENPVFAHSTLELVDFLVEKNTDIQSVVGGGETVAAVTQREALEKLYHVSTGGGAMLELIEGRNLPGIEALKLRDREVAELKQFVSLKYT
jgi:phosphoglycerate kinase